jgi:hypothetical protein
VEEGADLLEFCSAQGRFAPIAASLAEGAEVLVVGRRGTRALTARRPFGRSFLELVRLSPAPIFVSPLVFLPIRRALVLQTGAEWPDEASDFLAMSRVLDGLRIDVVQTRQREGRSPALAPNCASGAAVDSFFTSTAADLLVLSKSSFLEAAPDGATPCQNVLARWRVPMLLY